MSYDGREKSTSGGKPFELYLFVTETQTWCVTSGDKARTFQGRNYTPVTIVRTNTSQSGEVKGGHVKVSLPKDHAIPQLFVGYIPSAPLFLTIFRGHDGEAESETVTNFTGRVLSCQFTTDDKGELDCAPEQELLKRQIATPVFQKPCNRILYSEGCGVNPYAFSVVGVLASVSADGITITAPEFAGKPDGWFNTGFIEVGTERRMILSHAVNTLTLISALNGLAPGASVTAYAGCDRTYSGANGCAPKFNNGLNFFGYEWIPTKNPFSSGVN